MKIRLLENEKGVTLIELLVALVIAAITLAGVYKVFISQTKTYAVQDQVLEVQQSTRSAMEVLLRDLRMIGFDDDNPSSAITILNPIATPLQDHSIVVNYEYYDRTLAQYQSHQVAYAIDGSSNLVRTLTVDSVARPAEIVLPNVTALTFTYGIDANSDGVMDDQNANGQIDDNDYVAAASVGPFKVVAVRVVLTGRPDQTNTDVSKMVSPRTLTSGVTPRNICLR